MRGIRRNVHLAVSLAAMAAKAGCAAPRPSAVQALARANPAAIAGCLAQAWEREGFGVQARTEGEGWRVEAFGMPPSLRAAGRVPPRLMAELQPVSDGGTRVALVAAPTLLSIGRGVEDFGPRVADCLAGRLHTEQP